MSMGCGANYADVIENGTVEKMFPKKYKAFMEALKKANLSFDEFAQEISPNDESLLPEITKTFNVLKSAFDKKTGLELCLGFHDSANQGDIYDDVSGGYFSVDGMYQYTPAGKKMGKVVNRRFFVTYG
jgi:hypothetical protein